MVRSLTTPTVRPAPATDVESDLELQLDGPAAAFQAEASPGHPAAPHGLALDIGSATSVGRIRQRNEDSLLVQHQRCANLDRHYELALVAVADGMGGYEAGDRASALVVCQLGEAFAPLLARALTQDVTPEDIVSFLDKAIKSANAAVLQQAQADPHCQGMGATLAAVVISDDEVRVGHVGDCRVYHIRAGELKQVTRDQTLVARMVELGTLTPEEARRHPQRNEVTQAVGKHADIRPARYRLQLRSGDWLLVASDGLHAHVDEPALLTAVLESTNPASLAQHLVSLADQGGGSDNCTVVAIVAGEG